MDTVLAKLCMYCIINTATWNRRHSPFKKLSSDKPTRVQDRQLCNHYNLTSNFTYKKQVNSTKLL